MNIFDKNSLFLSMNLIAMPLYVKGEVGTIYSASMKYFEGKLGMERGLNLCLTHVYRIMCCALKILRIDSMRNIIACDYVVHYTGCFQSI